MSAHRTSRQTWRPEPGTPGAGRLPARLRHRRTLLVPPVPAVPAECGAG